MKDFKREKKMFAGSKWVYFCINLHIDITTFQGYLPPGIKIEIDLHRNTDAFCLLSDDTSTSFVIELDDIRLSVNRIIPSDPCITFICKLLRIIKHLNVQLIDHY